MTNADKFKHLFGIYATELWAMPESDFLEWLNADAQDIPTVERKTGKWINRWAQNGDQVKEVRECSECGAAYLRYYDTADGFDCVPPKYCPNCGAKMEVE